MPHMIVPECIDDTELPQKDGVVVRRSLVQEHTLAGNMSVTCQLIADELACDEHEECEWRGDFHGRCRLWRSSEPSSSPTPSPSTRPSVSPSSVPTATLVPTPITLNPSSAPTIYPTALATTIHPTLEPVPLPTLLPTLSPTASPQPGIVIGSPHGTNAPLLLSENGTLTAKFTIQLTTAPLSRVWLTFTSKFGHGKFH